MDPNDAYQPFDDGAPRAGEETVMTDDPPPGGERPSGADPGQRTRRLERLPSERILAGVAAGVARYFGLDVSLVRVGFVILSLFGGFGLVLYAAGWILMPEPGNPAPATDFLSGSRWRKLLLVAVAIGVGIVTLRIVATGPWGASWHAGWDIAWVVVVGVIGLLVVRGMRPNGASGHVLRRTAAFGLALVVLLLAATICTEVVSGVPFRGGIGSRDLRPTSVQQLSPTYRAAIGNLTLDLTAVPFPDKVVHLTASVGIGHLVVDVPDGVQVSVTAKTGVGAVAYGPAGLSSFLSSGGAGTNAGRGPVLVIDASVGIGQVQLDRVPSTLSTPLAA